VKTVARAVPFAIAGFMLTPFALWAAFWFAGLQGVKSGFDGPEAVVLLVSSLPLAGLFWIRNLREIGDGIASPSRLRLARALTIALPAAIAVLGTGGVVWLSALGRPLVSLTLVAAAVAVMGVLGWRAASPEAERACGHIAASEGWSANLILLVIAKAAMALALLAMWWTPAVLFWAVLALVPVAFGAILLLAKEGEAQ